MSCDKTAQTFFFKKAWLYCPGQMRWTVALIWWLALFCSLRITTDRWIFIGCFQFPWSLLAVINQSQLREAKRIKPLDRGGPPFCTATKVFIKPKTFNEQVEIWNHVPFYQGRPLLWSFGGYLGSWNLALLHGDWANAIQGHNRGGSQEIHIRWPVRGKIGIIGLINWYI